VLPASASPRWRPRPPAARVAERAPRRPPSRSGPAPVLMRAKDWATLTPDWERFTFHIENTKEAVDKLGWVREMYAFSIAAAVHGVGLDLKRTPRNELIAQPPNDQVVGEAAMLHYTWGALWFDNERRDETKKFADSKDVLEQIKYRYGPEVWRFEKRDFWAPNMAKTIDFQPMPPTEWNKDKKWTMQAGEPVTQNLWDMETLFVGTINEAVATLDDLALPTRAQRRQSVVEKMERWLDDHPGDDLDWFDIDADYVESPKRSSA